MINLQTIKKIEKFSNGYTICKSSATFLSLNVVLNERWIYILYSFAIAELNCPKESIEVAGNQQQSCAKEQ